jgi:hypothetical protein
MAPERLRGDDHEPRAIGPGSLDRGPAHLRRPLAGRTAQAVSA